LIVWHLQQIKSVVHRPVEAVVTSEPSMTR